MNEKSLKLADIVRRDDFTRELSRAASISHETQEEAHYIVYLTEDGQVKVNEAIPGIRELNPLNRGIPAEGLTGDHYNFVSPEDSDPDYEHETNKGGYIELYSCSVIRVHFHPPKDPYSAIPSPGDFDRLNASRRQNDNIVDLCSSNEDKFIEYVNPIEIVGRIIDNNPNSYELFAGQEKSDKPIDFNYDFMKRVAKSLNKRSGQKIPPNVHAMFGFGDYFREMGEFTQFINEIGLHTAGLFGVTGQDYSDLGRISMFQPKLVRRENLFMQTS